MAAEANTVLGYGLLNIHRVKTSDNNALAYRAARSFTLNLAARSDPHLLQLGFLDPDISEQSFDALHLQLSVDNHSVLDELFIDAGQAQLLFDDHPFAFDGSALDRNDDSKLQLTLILDAISSHSPSSFSGSGINIDFIIAGTVSVSLPSPAWLFGVSIIAMLYRRRQ